MSSYVLWRGEREALRYWRRYLNPTVFAIVNIIGILALLYFLSKGGRMHADFTETFALIMLAIMMLYMAALFRRVLWAKTRLILKLNFTNTEVVMYSIKKTHHLPYAYFRDARVKLIKLNKYGSSSRNKRPYLTDLLADDFAMYDAMIIDFGGECGSDFVHLYLGNMSPDNLQYLGKEWLDRYACYMKNERPLQRKEELSRLKEVSL